MKKLFTALVMLLVLPFGAGAQMATPARFSVTDEGGANFSIPIQVPPGIAGITPTLALEYSSQSGNMIAGVGWTISGLSVITRCPRTLYQDGIAGPVTFTSTDRYCLDGQRLVAKVGADGAAGTEYRVEREKFSKIISYGVSGTAPQYGPMYFTVKTKEGLTMEYGNSTDSHIEAFSGSTVARVWALNKVTDQKGNFLTISYFKDPVGATYYPARIDYAGNSVTGLAPASAVIFNYEIRPDPLLASQGGARIISSSRLLYIQTRTASVSGDVLTYNLTYGPVSPSTGQSRLSRVVQCAGTGLATCLPPVNVTWDSTGASTNSFTWNRAISGQVAGGLVADMNGDGLLDMVDLRHTYINNGDGTYSKQDWQISGSVPYNGPIKELSTYIADMNGDGRPDVVSIIGVCPELTQYGCKQYTLAVDVYINLGGVGNFARQGWGGGATIDDGRYIVLPPADYNGDGRPDVPLLTFVDVLDTSICSVCTVRKLNIQILNNNGGGFVSGTNFTGAAGSWGGGYSVFPIDVNRDGIPDIVVMKPGNTIGSNVLSVYSAPSGGALSATTLTITGGGPSSLPGHQILVGDFDGDGYLDFGQIIEGGNNGRLLINIFRNTGIGFIAESWIDQPISFLLIASAFVALDVNGDGKTDIVRIISNGSSNGSTSDLDVYQSFGTGMISTRWITGVPFDYGQAWVAADIDGRGIEGLVKLKWNSHFDNLRPQLTTLNRVVAVGSLYDTVAIQYKTLPEALRTSSYFKDLSPSFPATVVTPPVTVVTGYEGPYGPHVSLAYGSLVSKANGRPWSGFNWKQEKNETTGVVSRTYFLQDFPFTGLIDKTGKGTSAANWSNLQLTQNTYGCTDFVSASGCLVTTGRNYFPYVSDVNERSWDINGAVFPRTQTTRTWDAYGNAKTVSVAKLDAVSGAATGYSSSTVNTYFNDAASWRIGLLLTSTTTSNSPEVNPGTPPPPPPPVLAVTPTNWGLGNLNDGVTASQVLTISNSGAAGALNLSSSNGRFAISRNTCPAQGGTLAGGASCTVSVSFTGIGKCGGTLSTVTTTITAMAGSSTVTSTGSAQDHVYKITDVFCR